MGSLIVKAVYSIPDVMCSACTGSIETCLKEQLPSATIHTDVTTKTLSVITEPSNFSLIPVWLQKIGFEATLINQAEIEASILKEQAAVKADLLFAEQKQFLEQKEAVKRQLAAQEQAEMSHLTRCLLLLPCGLALIILSVLGVGLPFIALAAIGAFSTALIFYSGWPVFSRALSKLFRGGQLSMETMITLSVGVVLGVSIAAIFFPALPFEFSAAFLILGSRHLGQYLESRMQRRILASTQFSKRLPSKVAKIKIIDKSLGLSKPEVVATSSIHTDDIIEVYGPAVIPCDGSVISASGDIYTTFDNGDVLPVRKGRGEKVLAGMRLESGVLRLRVSNPQHLAKVVRMDRALQQLQHKKTKTEQFTGLVVRYFIPVVLILAILIATGVGIWLGPIVALHAGIALLMGACPCTVGFIVPFTMRLAAARLMDDKIMAYNAAAIERAPLIKTFLFDLHGTLTTGNPTVETAKFHQDSNRCKAILLAIEQAVLKDRKSVIAEAIVHFCQDVAMTGEVKSASLLPTSHHAGISAEIDGKTYHFGNAEFMQSLGISVEKKDGAHQLFLASEHDAGNKCIMAKLAISDPLRPNIKSLIDSLKAQGKRVAICTGADSALALCYARQLGINSTAVYAGLDGVSGKKQIITHHQKLGSVAMVGDGANDAVAFASADLSIALTSGDEVSRAQADVEIEPDSLGSLVGLLPITQQTMAIVKQSLITSLVYNVVIAVAAVFIALSLGPMGPAVMAGLMVVQAAIVLANAYRIRHYQPQDSSIVVRARSSDATLSSKWPSDAPSPVPCFERTVSTQLNTKLDDRKETREVSDADPGLAVGINLS